MANKSERRRQQAAKKKAAKAAAMLLPGYQSRYAQRRTHPPILGKRRRMRHGTAGLNGIPHLTPGGQHDTVWREDADGRRYQYITRQDLACLGDSFGGWKVALDGLRSAA
jgi:hypothetical protein